MKTKTTYNITTEGVSYSSSLYEDYTSNPNEVELEYCIKNIRNPFNKLAFIAYYFFGVEQKHIAEVAEMSPYALGMRMTRLKHKMKKDIVNRSGKTT